MSLTTVTKRHLLTATVLLAALALSAFTVTQIDLTRQVRGLLPVANGGTAVSDFTFSGSTHKATTLSGSTTNAHCAQWDGGGNITDAGSACASGSSFAWGGSGFDGAIVADGSSTLACLGAPSSSTYTMTRDCFFTTLTVNTSVIINTQNFIIYASTSITVTGTIRNNGLVGTIGNVGFPSGSGGAAAAPGGCCNGAVAATLPQSAINGSNGSAAFGQAGGNGTTTVGAGGNGGTTAQSCSPSIATTAGTYGTWSSGAGGAGASGAGGGAANQGSTSIIAASGFKPYAFPTALTFVRGRDNTALCLDVGPPGSPGGGGGGGDGTNSGGGGGGAGGGGGSGGYMVLAAPTITVNASGIISSDGATGGNGASGGSPSAGNTGAGGGGAGGVGGHGGAIVLVYHTLTNSGAVHASAGSGGNGGTHGTAHGTGTNGSGGANGPSGVAGYVIQIPN